MEIKKATHSEFEWEKSLHQVDVSVHFMAHTLKMKRLNYHYYCFALIYSTFFLFLSALCGFMFSSLLLTYVYL